MIIDWSQKIIAELIDVFGLFLKGCILHIRTQGELVEGSDRWIIRDEDKKIKYTVIFQIKKEKF